MAVDLLPDQPASSRPVQEAMRSAISGLGTSIVAVDAGTDLGKGRPANAAVVYWMFDSGVDVGVAGANIVHVQPGDLIYVADA